MAHVTRNDNEGYAYLAIICDHCGKELNGTHDYYTIAGYDGKGRDYCNTH